MRSKAVTVKVKTSSMCRIGVGLSLSAVIFFCSGCVAYKFSGEYFPGRDQVAGNQNLKNLVLGVDFTDKSQSYELDTFVVALKKAALFREVEYMDRLRSADLILTSFAQTETNSQEACPMGLAGQILLLGSGGIIPQVCKTDYLVSFVLYAPNKKTQPRKNLSVRYETRSIVGWAALFYMPFADWTAQPSKERYPELLKKIFARESNGIQGLLE